MSFTFFLLYSAVNINPSFLVPPTLRQGPRRELRYEPRQLGIRAQATLAVNLLEVLRVAHRTLGLERAVPLS